MKTARRLNIHQRYSFTQSNAERVFLCCICLLALAGCIPVLAILVLRYSPNYAVDFGAYYVAAYMLNSGTRLYDSHGMMEAAQAAGNVPVAAGYIYPPFFAAMLRPLATISFTSASIIWLAINSILLLASTIVLLKILRIPALMSIPLAGFVLLIPAIYDTLFIGQVSALLTFLLVMSLYFSIQSENSRSGDIFAGVFLGIAIMIKIYPMMMILFYIVHRRITTIASMGLTLCATLIAGIVYGGGWENTKHWFTTVLPSLSHPTPIPTDQSLKPVIERLFSPSAFNVPTDFYTKQWTKQETISSALYPIIDRPAAGRMLIYFFTMLIVVLTTKRLLHNKRAADNQSIAINYALVVTMMLLVGPLIRDVYFVHLVIPIIVGWIYGRSSPAHRWLLLMTYALIILQSYWRLILVFIQTPLVMMCGFLGVVLVWLALLLLPPPGKQSEELARPYTW